MFHGATVSKMEALGELQRVRMLYESGRVMSPISANKITTSEGEIDTTLKHNSCWLFCKRDFKFSHETYFLFAKGVIKRRKTVRSYQPVLQRCFYCACRSLPINDTVEK